MSILWLRLLSLFSHFFWRMRMLIGISYPAKTMEYEVTGSSMAKQSELPPPHESAAEISASDHLESEQKEMSNWVFVLIALLIVGISVGSFFIS